MTDFSSTTTGTQNSRAGARSLNLTRRVSSETKASFKTTELIAYVVTVVAVLIASAIVDEGSDFGAQEAWKSSPS